jgi:hypothetical protein
MGADKREEGAAGRLVTADERVDDLRRMILETTMARAWLDFALREYGAHVVIANVPETMWFPPAPDGSLPGILLARSPGDAVRRLATLEPTHLEPTNGGR